MSLKKCNKSNYNLFRFQLLKIFSCGSASTEYNPA